MAIKISGTTVVTDARRGTFHLVNAGAYNQQELDDLVIKGVEVGDAVYNKDREALSYWDGTKWVPTDDACGEEVYLNPGTYNWTAPKGVTSVCVVCVGGGGAGGSKNYKVGGGGGGLGWRNNIPVTPGQSYKVVVGVGGVHRRGSGHGGDSYFMNTSTVLGGGGYSGNLGYNNGGRYVGQGGGFGGKTAGANIVAHGGAGAGGYTGPGGDAHNNCAGSPGEGGGGGAGQDAGVYWGMRGNGGGGVGIYGKGKDGSGGGSIIWPPNDDPNSNDWRNYCGSNPGKGGSPAHGTGTDGQQGSNQNSRSLTAQDTQGITDPVVRDPIATGLCSGYCSGGDRFDMRKPEAIYTNWIIFKSRTTGEVFEYESKETGVYDMNFKAANDVFDVTFRSTGPNFHRDADTRVQNNGKRLGLEDKTDADYDDLVIICKEGKFAGRYSGSRYGNHRTLTYTTGTTTSNGCGGGCECVQGKCGTPNGSGDGGFPGGGGGQQEGGNPYNNNAEGTPGKGGGGAVRIIWGKGRSFPSTRVGKNECGDGTPFRLPVLDSAGNIPTSSEGGRTITVTGASKTDGTLSSSLEFNWHRSLRSNGSTSELGWGTSNSIVVSETYSRYWAEVRAKDTEGNTSSIKSTNNCNIAATPPPPPPIDINECGQGQSSGPKWPPVYQATDRRTLSAGSIFDVGTYYNNRYIQYSAFFTKNGSTLQVYGSGRWQNEGSEVVTWSRGGGGRVKLTQSDEVHMITAVIEHEQVDNTSNAHSNTGAYGRSTKQRTSSLARVCKGNSSHITFHAGCVFNTQGHYVWASPDQSGYATMGDNYIKAAFKFFGVSGHNGAAVTFFTDDPNKIVAVTAKTLVQPRT